MDLSKRSEQERLSGEELLDRAYALLLGEVPPVVARAITWLREPKRKWIRIPAGLFLMALSVFWFLPIIGLEFIPLGLLIIAQDVPFLQRPVAKVLIWGTFRWIDFRLWFQRRWRKPQK